MDQIPLNEQGKVLVEVKSTINSPPTAGQKVAYNAAEMGQLTGVGSKAFDAGLDGKIQEISVVVLIPIVVEG